MYAQQEFYIYREEQISKSRRDVFVSLVAKKKRLTHPHTRSRERARKWIKGKAVISRSRDTLKGLPFYPRCGISVRKYCL